MPSVPRVVPLRRAVISARDGVGSFRISNASTPASPLKWDDFDRRFVLWRLRSDPHGAADVIAALASGVVPVLIPDRTTPDKIATLRHKLPRFDYFDGTHMHEAAEPVTADDRPFVGILTSGSTGEPKILIADEPSLVAGIRAINDAQRLDDVDSTGILLPLAYSFAFVNQLLWAILYERRITFLAGFRDPAGSIALLAEAGIEMICLVDLPPWTGPVGMLVQ